MAYGSLTRNHLARGGIKRILANPVAVAIDNLALLHNSVIIDDLWLVACGKDPDTGDHAFEIRGRRLRLLD